MTSRLVCGQRCHSKYKKTTSPNLFGSSSESIGAGVILSNVKLDHGEITVPGKKTPIPTGLKKFGAIVGDKAEIGCNSVLSPGSLIGRGTVLYPGTLWRGVAPKNSIVKFKQTLEIIARRAR